MAMLCTHTMGASVPSLHRESTDSLILVCVRVGTGAVHPMLDEREQGNLAMKVVLASY